MKTPELAAIDHLQKHQGVRPVVHQFTKQHTQWVALFERLGLPYPDQVTQLPPTVRGFRRLIVVPAVPLPELLCAVTNYLSLTNVMSCPVEWEALIDERTAGAGPYVIAVRARGEADPEYRNRPARSLWVHGITSVTLTEQLLHMTMYRLETGRSLDVDGYTLCAGTRTPDGLVPAVCSPVERPGTIQLEWFPADLGQTGLSARKAITPD